jgi:uracil-DNA glycosylase
VVVRRDGNVRRGALTNHLPPEHSHSLIKLLFIGEAPGETEDIVGLPFVGISGNILDFIMQYVNQDYAFIITNIVCCRPSTFLWDSEKPEPTTYHQILKEDPDYYDWYDHNREPTQEEAALCQPHIDELISTTKPKAIVYLGKIAETYKTKLPTLSLPHPAYIARKEYKLIDAKKCGRKLNDFIKAMRV